MEEITRDRDELLDIIHRFPRDRRYTLAILQDIQRVQGYLLKESLEYISEYLQMPLSQIYSMATFYKALSLKPKGRYIIKICNGTACHIRGSGILMDYMKEILGILPGETTGDGLFSLEVVNCLGACALAPVMVINGKYYGNMTKEHLMAIIQKYRGAGIYG